MLTVCRAAKIERLPGQLMHAQFRNTSSSIVVFIVNAVLPDWELFYLDYNHYFPKIHSFANR